MFADLIAVCLQLRFIISSLFVPAFSREIFQLTFHPANGVGFDDVHSCHLLYLGHCLGDIPASTGLLPLHKPCQYLVFWSKAPNAHSYIALQGPFNKKENAFIVIMASAAANAALGTEVLAVQRLYYNITPNPAASVLYVPENLRSLKEEPLMLRFLAFSSPVNFSVRTVLSRGFNNRNSRASRLWNRRVI